MPLHTLPPDPTPTPRTPRQPDDYLPMQTVTRRLAFEPDGWSPTRRAEMQQLFDGLAPDWHTRAGPERQVIVRDALTRGHTRTGGRCVEVGSGTGLLTPALVEHFDHVVSLDLAPEMLGRSPRPGSVSLGRADASLLPIRSGSVDAVTVVNMFLFAAEYARVLRPGGQLIFVSTSGDQTPIYLSSADVVAALEPALGDARAVASQFGFGTWTVVTKGDH